MSADGGDGAASSPRAISEIVEHVAHLLPSQAPIRIFVHHNTLHPFEHLPFDEAVIEGAKVYGGEPYQSEAAFAEHVRSGRILDEDVDAVLGREQASLDEAVLPGGPTRRELRRLRLLQLFEIPTGAALEWQLCDSDLLGRLREGVEEDARARLLSGGQEAEVLEELWRVLERNAPRAARPAAGRRTRERLRRTTGVDTDELVHPLLGRICAKFLDQGIAYWPMPHRERGLLAAFRILYGAPGGPPDLWLRGLAARLRAAERDGWSAERTIAWALGELGVPGSDWPEVIQATLLSLKGWAGMIRQLETRPDRAPVVAPPTRLMDFLAVRLTLDLQATEHVARTHLGARQLAELADTQPAKPATANRSLVFEAFVLAQLAGVSPGQLSDPAHARAWLDEVSSFNNLERRRLLHAAYERRHRVSVLDALLAHRRLGSSEPKTPAFHALFCIDDREESLRRHLEEVEPAARTFGYAGFFGVAMAYQGLHDLRPTPLCPVVVTPRHKVVEEPVDGEDAAALAARRRSVGQLQHAAGIGSRTLLRGSLVSSLMGMASVVPLVGHTLLPRLAARLGHNLHHGVTGTTLTRLRIERPSDTGPNADGLLPGYTVAEMAEIVHAALVTVGLVDEFSPLVLIIGHGSSSMNNPHESAHDCGATGGGRGGPNARAFAAMANHPGVRAALASRGVVIPDGTWLLGGYHNTCDDAVEFYDTDLVPTSALDAFATARRAFEEARRRDAHERCRRFESASHELDFEEALAHAEAHAVDLGQPRPEYGHCTNAVCVVGRRQLTRGLFMDRRAFLVSYDPTLDDDGAVLARLLQAVGPVGAGISLEYYFSFIDPAVYGCGTKLPHNIVGLIGVMDGHASDLRTGLPWQMVEIHEPVRLLTIVEAEPERLVQIASDHPAVGTLVANHWIQLVAWSPSTGKMSLFADGGFEPYVPESTRLVIASSSADYYRGHREHLACARITAGTGPRRAA